LSHRYGGRLPQHPEAPPADSLPNGCPHYLACQVTSSWNTLFQQLKTLDAGLYISLSDVEIAG
jgi:hypothetical protein